MFKFNDIVVIKRANQGPGLQQKTKHLGTYKDIKVKLNGTYDA